MLGLYPWTKMRAGRCLTRNYVCSLPKASSKFGLNCTTGSALVNDNGELMLLFSSPGPFFIHSIKSTYRLVVFGQHSEIPYAHLCTLLSGRSWI